MNKKGYHLVILTSKLEIIVLSAASKEAARAADLLIRGEDREKAEAGDPKKLIGSWLIDLDTGNVEEAYGLRCRNVDPEEYGYIRMNTQPNGTIDNPPIFI